MNSDKHISLFEQELHALDARLVRTARADAAETVRTLLHELGAGVAALGSDTLLEGLGLAEVLENDHFGLITPPSADWSDDEAEEWIAALAGADAGITSALGASAETGTLLLPPHHPDERAVSLVPPVHIALLERGQLVDDIGALFRLWEEKGPVQGSAVMVTGPSRTADIEKELVLGVHGPGTLVVVLVE